MTDVQLGEYRDVVVFSGATPKYEDLSQSHRGGLRASTKRQDFSIDDLGIGISYHASYSQSTGSGLSTPRHHHDFEQVRFILGGEMEDAGKRYGPGWLGYFPEGTYYGPQARFGDARGIVLQFTGPSGVRFPTRDEVKAAQRALREAGCKFEDGICMWPDGRKQDGAEAMHMQVKGGAIKYPPERYSEQVWMNTENFPWQATDRPGVSVRRLGYFNDPGPAVQMIRLEPGASTPPGTTTSLIIRWVYEGAAEYHGQPLPSVSNLYYPPEAPYDELKSEGGATILSIELPSPGSQPPLPYRL